MTLNKISLALGLCLSLSLGVYLAQADSAGARATGGQTGPGVAVQLASQTGDAKPAPAQKEEPKKQEPAPAKPAGQDKTAKPADTKPAGAPAVPVIPPDEGC